MSKRALFLLVLILSGGGYFAHKHWAQILVFLRLEASGADAALALTRHAYSMVPGQDNHAVVMSRTSTVWPRFSKA